MATSCSFPECDDAAFLALTLRSLNRGLVGLVYACPEHEADIRSRVEQYQKFLADLGFRVESRRRRKWWF